MAQMSIENWSSSVLAAAELTGLFFPESAGEVCSVFPSPEVMPVTINNIRWFTSQVTHTRNIRKVLGRSAGQWRVSHVDQKVPLIPSYEQNIRMLLSWLAALLHNLGAAGRGPEHGAPGGGGVVSWHVLLISDDNSPGGDVLTSSNSSCHGRGWHANWIFLVGSEIRSILSN